MTFDSLEANEASGLAPLQAAAIGWLWRVIDEQGRSADCPTPAPSRLFALIYDWGGSDAVQQLCRGASTLIWLWAQNFNSVSSFLLWCRFQKKKQLKFETGADQRWNRTGARIPGSQRVGPSINKKPSLLTLNWLVNRNIYVTLWCSLRKAKWQPTRSRRAANSEPSTKEGVLRPK